MAVAGAKSDGVPGLREHGPKYIRLLASLDPMGNNIEAVCNKWISDGNPSLGTSAEFGPVVEGRPTLPGACLAPHLPDALQIAGITF
jgi:hypothetical protein